MGSGRIFTCQSYRNLGWPGQGRPVLAYDPGVIQAPWHEKTRAYARTMRKLQPVVACMAHHHQGVQRGWLPLGQIPSDPVRIRHRSGLSTIRPIWGRRQVLTTRVTLAQGR